MAVAVAAAVALVPSAANASQGGVYLKTGDLVCTDKSQSSSTARMYGWVINGSGTITFRTSTSLNGPETVIRSATNSTGVDWTVTAPAPGTFFRGCFLITTHHAATWTKGYVLGQVSDLGPNTATLSPGAWACGDSGFGPVTLTGSASADVTWYITGFDTDYAWVGTVFSTTGASVNATFTPGPDLTELEMCVLNSSASSVTTAFELSQA